MDPDVSEGGKVVVAMLFFLASVVVPADLSAVKKLGWVTVCMMLFGASVSCTTAASQTDVFIATAGYVVTLVLYITKG